MKLSDVLRTFVAVLIPSELKRTIAVVQKDLKKAAPGIKWVEPENFHITLEFLGDTKLDAVDEIAGAIAGACRDLDPFIVEFGGVGAFPSARRPRVVWAGVTSGKRELTELAGRVEDALAPLGFAKEDKPFRAHITLGRVRYGRGVDDLSSALEETAADRLGSFRVASVALMKSELRRECPIYSVLARVSLGETEGGV